MKSTNKTLSEIAELANVHISTASRALRGDSRISEATMRRVRQVAEELEYRTNVGASRLALGRTHAVEIVLPRMNALSSGVIARQLEGIGSVASAHGYDLYMATSQGVRRDWTTVFESLLEKKADGCIVFFGSESFDSVPQDPMVRSDLPVVFIDNEIHHRGMGAVNSDNIHGGELATQHLIELGHQRIAFVGSTKIPISHARWKGYCRALEKAGLAYDPSLAVEARFDLTGEIGAWQMRDIWARQPRPTAVFFANGDMAAIGAINTAKAIGLKIPDDLSIVGYDDIACAPFCVPALTTIRQDSMRAGCRAMEFLIQLIEHRDEPHGVLEETVPVSLILRNSTGPCRAGG